MNKDLRIELEIAFADLKRKHPPKSPQGEEASIMGNPWRKLCDIIRSRRDALNGLERFSKSEENACLESFREYCPDFYTAIRNSGTVQWKEHETPQIKQQAVIAEQRFKDALTRIESFEKLMDAGLSENINLIINSEVELIKFNGLGRPWGTALRRKIAAITGLGRDVDNLFTLALNSVSNADQVRLGKSFVDLIKKDPEMKIIFDDIEKNIINDIVKRAAKPYFSTLTIPSTKLSGKKKVEFGGNRNRTNMLTQLFDTVKNPFSSMSKYADTWKVAMNQLTWSIRHGAVFYTGVYHAVCNSAELAFLWEMEFYLEDYFDLRPHSGAGYKLEFTGGPNGKDKAYNVLTSILGTVYHDIMGNTDGLKVRVKWRECRSSTIIPWTNITK